VAKKACRFSSLNHYLAFKKSKEKGLRKSLAIKSIRSIVKLYKLHSLSLRSIGATVNQPHTTVKDYICRYKESGLSLAALDSLTVYLFKVNWTSFIVS
jgi:hypothetical protein